MLSDFFRINLPYGLAKNERGQWMAFNREYKPIGFSKEESDISGLPVYVNYKGLTDGLIREITSNEEGSVNMDETGKITRFWLYNDSTNPMNQGNKDNPYWGKYWEKLEKLARLDIKRSIDE